MLLSFLQCNEPTCYTLLFYGNYSLIKSKIKLLIDNIKTNIQNIAFLTLKMTWEKNKEVQIGQPISGYGEY